MQVFIDAERLGTHNQFYDRFEVRNKVLTLINEIFGRHTEIFQERIQNYAKTYKNEITKMLTLLMNDVTFLIDEVIEKLTEIHKYQQKKSDPEQWNKLDKEQQHLEENKFLTHDRQLKPESKLLNSSLDFMVIICGCLQDYFMELSLSNRLACLLNYCLEEFTSKSAQLKVNNSRDYDFNPFFILASLIKIYSAFFDYDNFFELVVKDQRSYKLKNFELAMEVKEKSEKLKVDYEAYDKFTKIVEHKLKEAEENAKKHEVNYDDAPDEFIDPITNELMEDPVTLPTSHMNMDRVNVEMMLLSNPIDPFNRNPLKKEDLIENKELKEKIIAYKKSKINN